ARPIFELALQRPHRSIPSELCGAPFLQLFSGSIEQFATDDAVVSSHPDAVAVLQHPDLHRIAQRRENLARGPRPTHLASWFGTRVRSQRSLFAMASCRRPLLRTSSGQPRLIFHLG